MNLFHHHEVIPLLACRREGHMEQSTSFHAEVILSSHPFKHQTVEQVSHLRLEVLPSRLPADLRSTVYKEEVLCVFTALL